LIFQLVSEVALAFERFQHQPRAAKQIIFSELWDGWTAMDVIGS
jgi:hypothetical protein